MTRKAGYPLGRAPWASGEAGIGVVDVRPALPPTAVHARLLVPLDVAVAVLFALLRLPCCLLL